MSNQMEEIRRALAGEHDGKRLSVHMQETADTDWIGEPFTDIADCDGSWKSLFEHEAVEVSILEGHLDYLWDALAASQKLVREAAAALEALREENTSLRGTLAVLRYPTDALPPAPEPPREGWG